MTHDNDRPEYARDYRRQLGTGQLSCTSPPIANYWHREQSSIRAIFTLSGTLISVETAETIVAYANLQLNPRNPLLRASLIWDGKPIYRLDIGGNSHRNPDGISVDTPHRHFYREPDGLWRCEAVDLAGVGIASNTDHEAIARYFFDWCGLDVNSLRWQNPPELQSSLVPPVPPRFGSSKRSRR